MAKFISTFRTLPKELFRVNYGPSIRLRAWSFRPKGSYDLVTEAGMVKPKALDQDSYAPPNGASLRPNSPYLKRLVSRSRGSNIVIYSAPGGANLPEDLLLVHEHTDHYSLQAATEMTVEELNSKIYSFLVTHGKTLTKDEWLQTYPEPTETS